MSQLTTAYSTLERLRFSETGLDPAQEALLVDLLEVFIREHREAMYREWIRHIRKQALLGIIERIRDQYPNEPLSRTLSRFQTILSRWRRRHWWRLSRLPEIEVLGWWLLCAEISPGGGSIPGPRRIRQLVAEEA